MLSDEYLANETPEERRARWRSLTIGGTPVGTTLRPTDPNHVRPMQQPSAWEKATVKQQRPGGFEIPYVHASNPSAPITNKQMADRRGHYQRSIERLQTASHPQE